MTTHITESVINLYSKRPRVAILMSGQGSNANAILKDSAIRDLYDISVIATDNRDSYAAPLSQLYNIDLLTGHAERFTDNDHRQRYFAELLSLLSERKIQAAFYAGFMKISTPDFCEAIPGVNVHPADLSIKDANGVAKYRGMRAMQHMRSDLGYVRSTVHVIDTPVDTGSAIAISDALYPGPGMDDKSVHEALKAKEHLLYTRTLRLLGQGALHIDELPLIGIGDSNE